jgi:hypothetical protein
MAFLTNVNDEIIVGAALTEYGRSKLAHGLPLGITKFLLSDDGVDYLNLWNPNNPHGEAFDGIAIERMAIQEPISSTINGIKYNLFTSDAKIEFIHTINHGVDSLLQSGVNTKGKIYYISPKIIPAHQNDYYVPWYKLTIGSNVGDAAGQYIKITGKFTRKPMEGPGQYSPGYQEPHNGYFAGEFFTVEVMYTPSIPLTFQVQIAAVIDGISPSPVTTYIQLFPSFTETLPLWEGDIESSPLE